MIKRELNNNELIYMAYIETFSNISVRQILKDLNIDKSNFYNHRVSEKQIHDIYVELKKQVANLDLICEYNNMILQTREDCENGILAEKDCNKMIREYEKEIKKLSK